MTGVASRRKKGILCASAHAKIPFSSYPVFTALPTSCDPSLSVDALTDQVFVPIHIHCDWY